MKLLLLTTMISAMLPNFAQARIMTCANAATGVSIQIPLTKNLIENRGFQMINGIQRKGVAVKRVRGGYLIENCPDDSFDSQPVFHFSRGTLDGKFYIGLDLYTCTERGFKEYISAGDSPLECR